jgi:hypothetical protein
MRGSLLVTSAAVVLVATPSLHAGAEVPLFSDQFRAGPSGLWRNESGGWIASGGTYSATAPDNFPNVHSSLPYVLADGSVDVDINDVQDGGIWVRSSPAPGTAIGVKGVLLVTGGGPNNGTGIYWHVVTDGQSYGSVIGAMAGLFTPGSTDAHITVSFVGDTYRAYVNGTLMSTITNGSFDVGCVALYDNSGQTFDNVAVYGEPLCSSDLSCDLVVDAADLAILLGAWGQAGIGDLDENGTTDAADLAILLGAWGPCS